MLDDVHEGVDLFDRVFGAVQLLASDIGLAVHDLPLEVRLVHDVVVDEPVRPDPGGREVHRNRRAEPACADAEHLRILHASLPVHRDVGDDQMPGVAPDLLVG